MLYIIVSVLLLLAWGIAWILRPKEEEATVFRSLGLVGLPLAWLLLSGILSINQVSAGHVGIVYTFGGITNQRGDGLQFVWPWQSLVEASVQVQGHKFPKLASFSKQTQDVLVDATINVRVSPDKIQELYREVGPRYFEILVSPRVLQAFKDETVKYDSVEIAPNREQIRKAVRERLTLELREHSITVQDLLIDNISFSQTFQAAIEKKQEQTQLALAEEAKVAAERHRAEQAVEQARGRAESVLVEARKQAEANKTLAQSLTPEYLQYLYVTKLSPNVSVMLLPANQPFILDSKILGK